MSDERRAQRRLVAVPGQLDAGHRGQRLHLVKEVEMLERAVREQGVLSRRELGRLVGCRYWGPGRYGRALRTAVRDGRIRRMRAGMYGPV